jgi:hypothetical protein
MRRWLLILMIALLPVQTGWAAIAGACADAGDRNAAHFGHHSHHDKSSADQDADDPDTAHLDCPTCHGIGLAVPLGSMVERSVEIDSPSARFVALTPPQPPPGGLLRPPALRVA